jgi:GlpG protein
VSVVVFVLMRFGEQPARAAALYISECVGEACPPFSELRAGQAWRLFTPMFLHFGILHILGNMLWLKDLGSMFEARMRSWYFAVFVLTVAAMSNMAQYLATSSPAFGGMSGVVFGLIGYCYVRGRFDPGSGIHLDRNSMIFALIWFALCFTGMVGRIANVAHTAGLVLGAVWAFVDSKRRG